MNSKRAVTTIVAALTTLAVLTGVAFALVQVTRDVDATVEVQVIAPEGIEIFLDEALTLPAGTVAFGSVDVDPFGTLAEELNVPVWVRNITLSGIRLSLSDDLDGADVIFVGEEQNPVLAAGEVLPGALSLHFTEPSDGTFPFTITFQAEGPVDVPSSSLTFWSDLAAKCEKRGGHLRMGHRVSEFTNLNPATINQVIQFSITAEVLSGLTQFDPNLVPVPDLAESWEVSSDLQTYTFSLRENARFHTGRLFTADDVVFTYDNQLDPNTQSIHTKGLEGVNRPVKIDDFTVEISTAFPRASFLTKVVERASGRVMTIVDQETIAEVGQGGYNRIPVGVGPFRITEHFFGERLELEAARDTYFDSSVPCLDQVTMFNIPESNTLIASLSTGQVDMIYEFAPQFWDQLEETPGVIVDTTSDVGFQMIVFNKRGDREEKTGLIGPQPWDNQEIVYALGNGFDRQAYIDRAFQGRAIPSYGAIPPGQPFYFRDLSATSRKAFDLDLAIQRMSDNGFPDGFEVNVLTTPDNKVPLEVLADLLKNSINVTLVPDIVEASVYQPRRAAGEWEAFTGGSGGDPDPDDAIDDWFADGSKFNSYGYNDEIVNRLNLKQKASIDLNKRLELILQISDRMDETFHGVFLHHNISRTAYRDDVRGYVWIHALRQLGAVWLDR